ncbi:MAG: PEGA domain-containing protein [Myxococcota bacterium]
MLRRVPILLALAVVLSSPQAAEAQRRVRINIESTPPGAAVFLDSEDGQRLGTTPIKAVIVTAGQHTLIFKKDNHETAKLDVNVQRWRETFRAVLDPLAALTVSPVNEGSHGATLVIDGETKGTLPWKGTLQPGRHLVQVKKDGFETYEQWHRLDGGQSMTLPVMLEEEAPDTGSILVTGDRPGATILIDGDEHGVTPTVIEDVPAGEHEIEVRADGAEPFKKTVRVEVGKRLTVTPEFGPQGGPTGSLRIVTQPDGATVSVDGETVGTSPATKEGLPPGEHVVQASADGYASAEKEIEVEAGQQRVVSLKLEQEAGHPGRIVVNATVNDAVVYIDGEDKGPPPVVVENASPGTHAIIVQARGYTDFRTTCQVGPGRDCDIMARMEGVGTPVRVEANAPGAEFYVDGELQGPVPWEGDVPAGSHRIEVRAPGFEPHVQQVNLRAASETRGFNVTLRPEGAKDEEDVAAERQRRMQATREAASYSAAALPQDMTVVDVSLGWPWLAEGRLGVGILEWLEAGFAARTFGRLTEFEGRAKAGYRPLRQLAVGGQFKVGGGIGPSRSPTDDELTMDPDASDHPTNSFFMSLELLGSLHFSQAGAFTLWFAADLTSDRWDFDHGNADVLASADIEQARNRQTMWRARLGGTLEILINRNWNVYALLEGIVGGSDRRVYGDVFGLNNSDFKLYTRLGFTYKFGMARERGMTFAED